MNELFFIITAEVKDYSTLYMPTTYNRECSLQLLLIVKIEYQLFLGMSGPIDSSCAKLFVDDHCSITLISSWRYQSSLELYNSQY